MTKRSGVTGKTVPQHFRSLRAIIHRTARDARSTEEQLALLDQRPGASARERKRLTR